MFLTKKNAAYFNKPSKRSNITPRVLPGWGDDDDQIDNFTNAHHFQYDTNEQNKNNDNLLEGFTNAIPQSSAPQKDQPRKLYYDWDQLNEMNSMYEFINTDNAKKSLCRPSWSPGESGSNPMTIC